MVGKPRREKSRKISIYEYFQILQVEWVVADLRLRTYPRSKCKEYWRKVRDGKKVTIEDMADKNHLPSIFTDDTLKKDVENKVFRVKSYPNFHYKNEENRANQEYWDLKNYYSSNADVRLEYLGEIKAGKVKSYEPYDTFVVVDLIDGEQVKVNVQEVTRIL